MCISIACYSYYELCLLFSIDYPNFLQQGIDTEALCTEILEEWTECQGRKLCTEVIERE